MLVFVLGYMQPCGVFKFAFVYEMQSSPVAPELWFACFQEFDLFVLIVFFTFSASIWELWQ